MRITCTSLDDFLENLRGRGVFAETVYVDKTLKPNGNEPPRQAHSFEVYFQTSAVVQLNSEAQALVVCGVHCGTDRTTADGDLEGSRCEAELRIKLADFCRVNGLSLKPGVLDV